VHRARARQSRPPTSPTVGGAGPRQGSSIVVREAVGRCASFATTIGAQTGARHHAIFCFCTDELKQRYLPRLVAGRSSGRTRSDESGLRNPDVVSGAAGARGSRSPDEQATVLFGEKMWITNGGFADVFIVFAKVDGELFTAFIVERGFPGVTTGKEEHKLGLLGSSTTPLILQDARVPAENLLGEVGKGHKIAFNTLNYGRLKLAAMCSGGGRLAIEEAARYAGTRKQFGKPIASFGAIRQKLGDMASRQYCDRGDALPDDRDDRRDACAGHAPAQVLAALEEFAVEASMLKGGEQRGGRLHPRRERPDPRRQRLRARLPGRAPLPRRAREPDLRRHQRDQPPAIPGMLARRAVKGDLPLIPAAKRLMDEVMAPPSMDAGSDAPLDAERTAVTGMKKIALMVLGTRWTSTARSSPTNRKCCSPRPTS
jgi:alkylation response protein AidB-like acyl-CoA dehydrogenase